MGDMMDDLSAGKIDSDYLEEEYDLEFSVVGSDGVVRELLPGGINKKVPLDDFDIYRELLIQYHINEFKVHCDAIKRGLATIIPYRMLPLLNWHELRLQVCGTETCDIELLKQNTTYSGYSSSDPVITRFWDMMTNMFDDDEKCQFIQFVWGRRNLPIRGAAWKQQFKINKKSGYSNPDGVFPLAHTCFFSIDLPEYSSAKVMAEMIRKSMICGSIDADGGSAIAMGPSIDDDDDDDGGAESLFQN